MTLARAPEPPPNSILTKVSEISGAIATISSGATSQATSLDDVNAAVAQMDQDTQQNAAIAEQTTTASARFVRKATS